MPNLNRKLLSLEDAFRSIKEIQQELVKLTTHNLDLNGRRITNAGYSQDDSDYVIRKELSGISLVKPVKMIAGGSPVVPPATEIIYYTKTLTANSSVLAVPGSIVGKFIIITIYENGTGGWVQTWPSMFKGMGGFVQTTTANSYTAALFYCLDSTHCLLLSPPVTGII